MGKNKSTKKSLFVTVRLLTSYRDWRKGSEVEFDREKAEELVQLGRAVIISEEKVEEDPAESGENSASDA